MGSLAFPRRAAAAEKLAPTGQPGVENRPFPALYPVLAHAEKSSLPLPQSRFPLPGLPWLGPRQACRGALCRRIAAAHEMGRRQADEDRDRPSSVSLPNSQTFGVVPVHPDGLSLRSNRLPRKARDRRLAGIERAAAG